MISSRLRRISSATILNVSLAMFQAPTVAIAAPDASKWRLQPGLAAEWQLRMTKEVAMQPTGGFGPGGQIDMSKMAPVNYTRGDVVFTGKLAEKNFGKMIADFNDAPADWNKSDRAFEFAVGDYLVQVTGFPDNEVSTVFLRMPDEPAKPALKKPTVQKPAASGMKKDSTK